MSTSKLFQASPLLRSLSLGLAVAAALSLAACGRDDNRTAGQQLDSAIAKTEKNAAEAKANVQQGAADLSAETKAAADKAGQAMDKAGQAIDKAADKAAAAVEKTTGKAGDVLNDAGITASVNAELAKDQTLSALRINVDTTAGHVVLRGTAPSSQARERASTLAKAVKGVSSVDNQLEVRG